MAAYKTIYTRLGATALVQASTTGNAVQLSQMSVGDGAGNPTTPTSTQTTLIRERYRGPINRIYQDPNDNTRFSAELVVPASEGGFTMREVGVFDTNGTLIMVGNLPDSYKPLPEEGAYSDVVLAVDFFLTSDAVINLQFDPNTIIVNQTWLVNNWTAAQLIPGGTIGQVLGKETNADGDYIWMDPSVANVTVDTVAETQLLATNQTRVDLQQTTVYGLAVYVNGDRLAKGSGADEWAEVPGVPTAFTLGQSYTNGSKLQAVNNEPAGSAPAPLERAKNLSDVLNVTTARNNLDIFSKAEVTALGSQWAPPGAVMAFAMSTAPVGWLKANAAAVSRIAYAPLFAAIGTTFGAGDGFNTFNLPDMRGEFARGWDDGRGIDAGRSFGSRQDQAIQSHNHTGNTDSAGNHSHSGTTDAQGNHAHSISGSTNASGDHSHSAYSDSQGNHSHGIRGSYTSIQRGGGSSVDGHFREQIFQNTEVAGAHGHNIYVNGGGNHAHSVSGSTSTAGNHAHNLNIAAGGAHTHSFTTSSTGGTETRPRNVALLYCIKY